MNRIVSHVVYEHRNDYSNAKPKSKKLKNAIVNNIWWFAKVSADNQKIYSKTAQISYN
jgi:hypothetical protein